MNLLCWNCRGLGNRQTVQEFGDLVRAQDPAVVFLAETWLDEARLVNIRDFSWRWFGSLLEEKF